MRIKADINNNNSKPKNFPTTTKRVYCPYAYLFVWKGDINSKKKKLDFLNQNFKTFHLVFIFSTQTNKVKPEVGYKPKNLGTN